MDAVIAACPPQAHEQIADAAIAAGVPVFVEKPPATTTAALAELADAATTSGVVTGVGMNFRWAAPVRHIRALLDGGAYGRPTAITVWHVASKPQAPMWGLPLLRSFLLAQTIHPVDLLLQLAGEPVIDAHVVRQVDSTGAMVGLQLGFADGGVGSLACGSQAARFESRIEVTTSSGATMCATGLGELTVTGGLVPSEIGDPRGWSQLWRPSPLDIGSIAPDSAPSWQLSPVPPLRGLVSRRAWRTCCPPTASLTESKDCERCGRTNHRHQVRAAQ